MSESLEVGQMVFVADGELGIGAVREVGENDWVVNIQNGGDFKLPMRAIKEVHSGKVLLALDQLPQDVGEALRHPHDAEIRTPTYSATDHQDGALKD